MSSVRFKLRPNAPFEAMSFSGSAIKAASLKEYILTRPLFKRNVGIDYDIELKNIATSEVYEKEALIPDGTDLMVKKVSKKRLELLKQKRTVEALRYILLCIYIKETMISNPYSNLYILFDYL